MNENGARVSSLESTVESTVSNDAVQARRRKKRKWDQPADVMFTAGIALPGVLPLGNAGFVGGTLSPAVSPIPGFSINPLVASGTTLPHLLHAPSVLPKLNQPKIQEELVIAREIVINDAESSVRYKLTKRQTQEEIQRCTSAVVITRGKYRPPNAPPDGEKPLYLHISAGAHLKETAERILAVDRAAAMVEEMLKPGLKTPSDTSNFLTAVSNGVKALSTTVYLGFEPDPSLNISARIRGPNDQYINHIMNETGATVALRGRGAEIFQSSFGEEVPQPLHLFLSSTNPKSLEDAKHLAENLLDTISVECGASRVSSCKSYSAVPPPQQLLSGVQGSGNEESVPSNSAAGLESPIVSIMPVGALASVTQPGATTIYPQGSVLHYGGLSNCVQPLPAPVSYPPPLLPRATSYSGYGDIYPQATPLQQVALALRQPHSPAITSSSVASTTSKSSVRSASKEKQPVQRRKFQELPVGSNEVFSLTLYEANWIRTPLGHWFVCFTGFSAIEVLYDGTLFSEAAVVKLSCRLSMCCLVYHHTNKRSALPYVARLISIAYHLYHLLLTVAYHIKYVLLSDRQTNKKSALPSCGRDYLDITSYLVSSYCCLP